MAIGVEENPDEVAMEDPDEKTPDTRNSMLNRSLELKAMPAETESERLIYDSDIWTNNYALLVKRAHIYGRDRCGLFCELVCPFLMVLVGCLFAQI